ncbi:glycosyltransferase family 4 protein [Desulfolutivibrio sulfoxidireducens]|uniref:glycosyltransferase family 4 protein n=1 Tax=Desulfolutivibrio sulfoxidireducens TaxID=2773299 RepID=UPI00159EA694|nr:glycosyltransferase family 4 protein [Desulfolutivibrio sulfoxidireducens]QLA18669.1 glycosyltransferase [Desulfolutivibrio sulfoxidireducens]
MNPLKIAYVLLWFPLPSEMFIFREVRNLQDMGLPISVYSLYGPARKGLSREMAAAAPDVVRLGARSLPDFPADILSWRKRRPDVVGRLWRTIPWRRWSCLEVAGENLWAFFAGFRLATLMEAEGVSHVHAAWANGPATAAMVAAALLDVPFSFSGRAGDIHPQDGALADKIRAASFVHTNNRANLGYLAGFAQNGDARKIHLVYNSLTLANREKAAVAMKPPYRLLAVGRFCRTKGFDVLLRACRLLEKDGFPFTLTLVGSGFQRSRLEWLRRQFGLLPRVNFPGFVSHDRITELYAASDIFVMPSVIHQTGDRDGIPNVIMEALSHCLPVVATNISGIPEVVVDGETGRLVPQRDPAALARAIQELAADREKAVAMAEAGREKVLAMFDPKGNTRALLQLFHDAPAVRPTELSTQPATHPGQA